MYDLSNVHRIYSIFDLMPLRNKYDSIDWFSKSISRDNHNHSAPIGICGPRKLEFHFVFLV